MSGDWSFLMGGDGGFFIPNSGVPPITRPTGLRGTLWHRTGTGASGKKSSQEAGVCPDSVICRIVLVDR